MALHSKITAADAWRSVIGIAGGLLRNIPGWSDKLASGNVTLEYVFGIYKNVRDDRLSLDQFKATANLNAYVQNVLGDPTYNAVSNITDVTDAMQACLTWIDTNASSLNLSGDSAENALSSGSVVTNRFGSGATAPLRALLATVTENIQDA